MRLPVPGQQQHPSVLLQLLAALQRPGAACRALCSPAEDICKALGDSRGVTSAPRGPASAAAWQPPPPPPPQSKASAASRLRRLIGGSPDGKTSGDDAGGGATPGAPALQTDDAEQQQANGWEARAALAALRRAAWAQARRHHERSGHNSSSGAADASPRNSGAGDAAAAAAAWAEQAGEEAPGDLARGLLALARLGWGLPGGPAANGLRARVGARLASEADSGMAGVSAVEAAALSLGLARLAEQSPQWRAVLAAHAPPLVRRAAAGAAGRSAAHLTWALHAAGRAAGGWLFEGPAPCPAVALTDALAGRLHDAAPLLRSGDARPGGGDDDEGEEAGGGGGAAAAPRPPELSAAASALVAVNYYSRGVVQGLADCTLATIEAEDAAAAAAAAGGGRRGRAEYDRPLTLVHLSCVLFACAKFDHGAPALVAAAARRVAAALGPGEAPGGGDPNAADGGGAAAAAEADAAVVGGPEVDVRPLAVIAWAVAVLEPSRLDVARAVFAALARHPPPPPDPRPPGARPPGGAVGVRTLRQLSQAQAVAAMAARAAGESPPPQLPPPWRAAVKRAWAEGMCGAPSEASRTALAVAALLRRMGLAASVQQASPDGQVVTDVAVSYRGFTVALEVDGPNHFTAAPPSPSNAGGLFAAAPRRHHGDGRLRELLARGNPGWLVAVVPWFDWRPHSRLPEEGLRPSQYFRARLEDAVAPYQQAAPRRGGRGGGSGGRERKRQGAGAAGLAGGQLRWWAAEAQERLERTGEWPPEAGGSAEVAGAEASAGAADVAAAAHRAERAAQWRELALQQLRWRRDAEALLGPPQTTVGPRGGAG